MISQSPIFAYIHSRKGVKHNAETPVMTTENLLEFDKFRLQYPYFKIIATHDGSFSCDEVLACVFLKYVQKYSDSIIIRTRNSNILDQAHIVLGVGGKYDVESERFDYNKSGFKEKYDDESEIKLSSAGLIFKHYNTVLTPILEAFDINIEYFKLIGIKLYKSFVQEIDAIANRCSKPKEYFNYAIRTGIFKRVSRLNATLLKLPWAIYSVDSQFKAAMDVVEIEFLEQLVDIVYNWLPSRPLVEKAFEEARIIGLNPSNAARSEIVVLSNKCKWKEHINALENEYGLKGKIKFAVYKNELGYFIVQALNNKRCLLYHRWAGKERHDLINMTGFEDILFVHWSQYFGGACSINTAIKLAERSIEVADTERVTPRNKSWARHDRRSDDKKKHKRRKKEKNRRSSHKEASPCWQVHEIDSNGEEIVASPVYRSGVKHENIKQVRTKISYESETPDVEEEDQMSWLEKVHGASSLNITFT